MSWNHLSNIKKSEANTNMEPEILEEIRKRQVVSSANLRLLERIVHIPSQSFKKKSFLCNSNQFALTVASIASLVQKIFMLDSAVFQLFPQPRSSVLQCSQYILNVFLNDNMKQRARDCSGSCGTVTNER